MSNLNKITRRKFIEASGLAGAVAIAPIGRSGAGAILKHLIPEEEIIPGVSYWLNSTCGECPAGCGVKVRIGEGNAVKIEGNEKHPVNQGGLCARGQSALQALYSPVRIQTPLIRKEGGRLESVNWEGALERLTRSAAGGSSGRVAVVTSHVTGAQRAKLKALAAASPRLSFTVCEPLAYAPVAAANKLCFGLEAVPTYSFDNARTIVSFGADFLETWISPVGNAREYAKSRAPTNGTMSRVIQFESHMSLTGANADERYCCPPGSEMLVALSVALQMVSGGTLPAGEREVWRRALQPFTAERAARAAGIPPQITQKIADRLLTQTPSLAIAGGPTSRAAHATQLQVVVNLMNFIAGNYGKTLSFDRVQNEPVSAYKQLLSLVADMEAGRVAALIVHECNPEFSFTNPERFRAALKRVPLKVQLSSAHDAMGESYDMILPVLHWLERWDLIEPRSGIHSLQQPVVKPSCDAIHSFQTLGMVAAAVSGGAAETTGNYEQFLQEQWEKIRLQKSAAAGFDDLWRQVLTDGGYWAAPIPRKVSLNARAAECLRNVDPIIPKPGERFLLPITTVRYGDGRQTGRPWLHELPDPITTIAWDIPVLISPATAKEWNCRSGDIIKLKCGESALEAPVYVQEGTSDSVAAAPLGAPSENYAAYHHDAGSHPLHRLKGDVDEISGSLSWLGTPVTFERVTGSVKLARMQGSERQNGRRIAQAVPLSEVGESAGKQDSRRTGRDTELYPKHEHPLHDWTMLIDLSACIGCGACVIACHAENNVFVVGRKLCVLGRELSWLRIERFIDGGRVVFLPMMCQQCEHAPCETVCPVYAAVHNSEGLNVQVYNRCVGTRYCANNCPYKVRRFNWYTYKVDSPLEKQFNPDVSIRTRGIMEKCTFCIQRIREQKEIAKDERRPLRDGEVMPACAQSCPAGAIRFGDLKDPASRVSKQIADPRGYAIFEELNTQPSIVYLKRVYHPDGTAMKTL